MSTLAKYPLFTFIFSLLLALFFFMGLASLLLSSSVLVDHPILLQYLIQSSSALIIYLLPPFFVAFLSDQPKRELFLDRTPKFSWSLYVVVWMLLSLPAITLLSSLSVVDLLPDAFDSVSSWMKARQMELDTFSQKMLNVSTIPALLANLLCIAFIPALTEEIFFRSGLIRLFSRRFSLQTSVWVSAVVFSAIHFQFDGFIARMLLGAAYGYLMIWSRSVLYPILAHLSNNAYVVLATYYSFNVVNSTNSLSQVEITRNSAIIGVVSFLISFALLYIAKKRALQPSSLSNHQ